MKELLSQLQKAPLFYITRDIERALGLPLSTEGYFIISNSTPFGKSVAKEHKNVLLVEGEELLDTAQLMERTETVKFIANSQPSTRTHFVVTQWNQAEREPIVLAFKNTSQIEKISRKNNWRLLNPSAMLASTVEEKISQVEWLGEFAKYLPPHEVLLCKEIVWKSTPFMLQFNRAHTGTGTLYIESKEQLEEIQSKFPDRPARVTQFISGPVFTSNNVVGRRQTLVGTISYQITGLLPFTDNPFATIGNDWALPEILLSQKQKEQYTHIVNEVAEKMRGDGWKGLFGTDMVLDEKTGALYLLEINARQPASTTYESQLQMQNSECRIQNKVTTFEAHVLALLDVDLDRFELIEMHDGAQIILRKQEIERNVKNIAQKLKDAGFTVIEYANNSLGSDLLRIQGTMGMMSKHGVLNTVGEKIANIISLAKI